MLGESTRSHRNSETGRNDPGFALLNRSHEQSCWSFRPVSRVITSMRKHKQTNEAKNGDEYDKTQDRTQQPR
jgi:hypothetical protein